MAKSTKVKKQEITWLDAHSPLATVVYNIEDEASLKEVHSPLMVTTMGWILKDDEEGITLANEYCGDGDYRGLTFVLRRLIVEVKPITTGRKKKERVVTVDAPPPTT